MPATQIHPKVTAAALASAVFTLVVVVAGYFGVSVDPGLQSALTAVVAIVAGYLKPAPAAAFPDATDPVPVDGDDSIHAAA